jgi:hypothetical protein
VTYQTRNDRPEATRTAGLPALNDGGAILEQALPGLAPPHQTSEVGP